MVRVYPFLISGLLIILGLVVSSRMDAKIRRYVTRDSHCEFNSDAPDHLQPGPLRNVVCYWIDLTQSAALVIGPLLGVLILIDLSNPWLRAAYAAAILVGIGMILWIALRDDMSTYASRAGRLGITPVIALGLVVNIAAGFVAYFPGGPTHKG